MYGAIIGDIIGCPYEFHNIKQKEFPLFSDASTFTDDTVLTVAVAKALVDYDSHQDLDFFREKLVEYFVELGNKYPDRGYGHRFAAWLDGHDHSPYNSYGNGSGMRVSPVGFYAKSLREAETLAEASSDVTHNHPEGIRGAKAIAACIYLAKTGSTKAEIRDYIQENYYDLHFTLDEIRPTYRFREICQESVPQAIEAFLEGRDYEDTVRNAISIGGDSDTVACMAGGIAEAFFGIPDWILDEGLSRLDGELLDEIENAWEYFREE